jgi:hypothetical protein
MENARTTLRTCIDRSGSVSPLSRRNRNRSLLSSTRRVRLAPDFAPSRLISTTERDRANFRTPRCPQSPLLTFRLALRPEATATRISGSIKMPAMPWDELTRSEQRLLIRLFGGGSLRNQNAADIEGLSRRGLIDDAQNLSMPGLLVLTLAMREQQAAVARWRAGFGA